ncbi:hypothetical protein LOD99_13980 [Oopsacas minuta]|uniref:Uncharacterized protein n=1 Tax=Oopsacas minuta TaxID=111878 RepID=A0AAV7KJN0_9METZ|nr:hypothetical protein LOD99_13980 [Oopsacas minuta]
MKTFLSLCLLYVLPSCLTEGYTILRQQTGIVAISEHAYFSLNHQMLSPLVIVLSSLEGDCDLYVSQQSTTKRPTYQKYDLSSTTCGTDYVITSSSLKYPLFIGVFAYSSGEDCEFQVDIVQLDIDIETPEIQIEFDIERYVGAKENVKEDSEESHIVWTILKFIVQVVEVLA